MYYNLTKIQSGTFSTVYKAWSSTLERYVALKIMSKSKYSANGVANEYNIMKHLGTGHPNVCSMLDYYEDNDNYVLVLEYCECGDMYDFLAIAKSQGDALSPSIIELDFTKILRQLVSAIKYAHSLGIAHRDIKPENVLLTKEGNVKLADWGHATLESYSKDTHIGTDNYRAPETFEDRDAYNTYKIDYWSLGVTSLYLLFGQCPFKNLSIQNSSSSSFSSSSSSSSSDSSMDSIDVDDNKIVEVNSYLEGSNFLSFVKDPNAFIYRYYLAPIMNVKNGKIFSYLDSQVPLYRWKDMVNNYNLFYLSKVIISTLICIEAEQRSLHKFHKLLNKICTDSVNSNGSSMVPSHKLKNAYSLNKMDLDYTSVSAQNIT
ncbi:protein kinase FMP48 NDAI_0D04110 [Naumovozyma dairenensis CBS 421]|uniref:non-specific serine/threonine protein kinase n=1 Tax=Naumovozyma dairenensis (strain ATCC 10597 / BCRC 20456 / CBS 421 / NBRC 0211 / NRRL Y-12639) TaxID=1071378 RepID=G0WAB4_NAUDC|nr:hypothetical protein NDAI_0D04110 [Naumovozyma dairenensis CBS 421]CCD24725.1 hypothetical protein NDAI_0D04110 [Naumovozyma dairenensis CBS 421]